MIPANRKSAPADAVTPSPVAARRSSAVSDTPEDSAARVRRTVAAFHMATFLDDLTASFVLHRQRQGGVS